jgi:hypothetical protein
MIDLRIVLSEDLTFNVKCKTSEANIVLYKILKEFHANEDVLIHYESDGKEVFVFDTGIISEVYYDKTTPFYGKLKNFTVFNKHLTDEELRALTN